MINVKKERFKRVRSAASTRKEVNQIVFDEQRPSTLQQALLSRPSTGQSRKNRRDMYLSTQHELPPLNVKSNHLRVLPPWFFHWTIQDRFFTNLEGSQLINPFQSIIAFHIGNSLVISSANEITGFYLKFNNGLKWVKIADQWAGFYIDRTVFLTVSKIHFNFLCFFLLPKDLQPFLQPFLM